MGVITETFQGSTIEIEDESKLTINGKIIQPIFDNTSQQWSSNYLPYTTYPTLRDLAQAIVRDTEEFRQ